MNKPGPVPEPIHHLVGDPVAEVGSMRSEAQARQLEANLADKVRDLEAYARRASLLQRVTAALTTARTVQEVADVVTSHGRQVFASTGTLLFLLDPEGRALELCSFGGVDEGRVAIYDRIPIDADQPLTRAVRTGDPMWLGTRAEVVAAHPSLAAVALDGLPLSGVVALPVRDTREVIGGLAFSFYSEPALGPTERDFFLTIASQCGLALERARSFEAERRALAAERRANESLQRQRQRLAVLARAAETLSSSLDSRRSLAELTRLVVPELADWCAIDEVGPDGQIRRIATAHRDPARVALAAQIMAKYPPNPDAGHGVAAVLRTGTTEWVPDIPDQLLAAAARDDEHLALMRSLGLTSYATVPLIARGKVLGALSLVTEGERRLVEEDMRFAEELARRTALALENARLYETAEAAREHLHGLFMQAPAAICIGKGREHRYALANGPYQSILGRGALLGRTLRDVFPEAQDPSAFAMIERVFDTGESFVAREMPVRLRWGDHPQAGDRYFNVVFQATRDVTGHIDGVATFAFEVTDQVLAHRELEALAAAVAGNEARLRALVDATAAIVWTASAHGEVIEVSPSWLAFTGQTADEYRHGGFLDAIHPDDRARTMAIWASAVESRAAYAAEYRLRRHDGTYAHTLARSMPVLDANGEVREYAGCNVDVTELREAEAAARVHGETLETINELGQVIAAELDQQMVVQAVTDAATTLTGAQFGAFFYNVLDDHGGKYMLYTVSGVPREAFSRFPMPRNTEVFAPTFAGEGVVRVDDITKDPRYGKNAPHAGMPAGHLPVRSYLAAPVVSRSGEVIGGIFLGHEKPGVFTERAEVLAVGIAAQAAIAVDNARLYGEAQRLIKALELTNRELDQFAYVTSHDLRAPLRGIGSLAEWIEEDLGALLTPDARRKLELLRGRVQRMEALIQGILDFSRVSRSPSRRVDVDVNKLLAEVTELLAPKPPASVIAARDLPVVCTEPVALQQVLMNLVGNALKHAGRPDVQVRVDARESGENWEFHVTDNGPGIAPQFHARVWGIFQTLEARDKVENTGIGLAIVKKIVEGRGGRVWIESTEGHGATFCFTWPKRDEP